MSKQFQVSFSVDTQCYLSLRFPTGWQVVVNDERLVAVHGGNLAALNEEYIRIDLTGRDAAVTLFTVSEGDTLLASALAQMKRQLGGGYPEQTSVVFDGVAMLGFTWTDGVNEIMSWFAKPSAATAVRLDYSRRAHPERRPARSVELESLDLFNSLRWLQAL